MSLSDEQPLSRRALREARATGEQPTLSSADTLTTPTESTATSALPIGPDGQPLTRRRLRELREQGGSTIDEAAPRPSSQPEAEPEPRSDAVEQLAAQLLVAERRASVAPAVPTESESIARSVPPVVDAPAPAEPRIEAPPEPRTEVPAAVPSKPERSLPDSHWTKQLDAIEDEDEITVAPTREVGGANPTTSAIIIQEPLSSPIDLSGPLGSTGEILLTGSIPISQGLSATGTTEPLADSITDADDRFDDRRMHEAASSDAQPIRASAVASEHALGTPLVSDGKRRGGRGLTILLIAASALAVIITGLVVAAVLLKWI